MKTVLTVAGRMKCRPHARWSSRLLLAGLIGVGVGGSTLAQIAPGAGNLPPSPILQQTPSVLPPIQSSVVSANYQVGPGDTLRVDVYRSPDLTIAVQVSQSGVIRMPAIGALMVRDMTPFQVAGLIAEKLKADGILLNPSVNVSVLTVGSKVVSVMGAVARPGDVPLDRPNLTLAEILARAGATFGTGDGVVTLVPGGDETRRQDFRVASVISGARNPRLAGGDLVIVEAAPVVYVTGEVNRPGAYSIEPEMTVGQAIVVGGGATTRGSLGRLRLERRTPDGRTVTVAHVKLTDMVQPDDLILVKQRVF